MLLKRWQQTLGALIVGNDFTYRYSVWDSGAHA